MVLLTFLMMGSLFFVFWFLFDGDDSRRFKMGSSRLDLALYGGPLVCAMGLFISMAIAALVRLFKR
ncbi:hypothetical protein DN826_14715 [Stutzerimonas nosocomialis]|uniref:DUF3955 domain-containing protein n=1 Tax=Stutzerimonas nosocomialis TaxID=1056496 RepID=A0A5R9QDR4_9GAMM|nr:hypothetical protein DN826_14715 [Stutzerimonas nosocomialis]TLX63269.1 hypothetical protein DN820_12135 [Stutzerimonas nosocomialis]